MAEDEEKVIDLYLALLDKDIEAGRNIREMPEELLARMMELLDRPE